LGIRFVGETTAKTLARSVNHLLDFQNYSLEDLQNLEDMGQRLAAVFIISSAIRIILKCSSN
jgi:DNA ligase (NAD+)